jgi:hypothetical protein
MQLAPALAGLFFFWPPIVRYRPNRAAAISDFIFQVVKSMVEAPRVRSSRLLLGVPRRLSWLGRRRGARR